MPSTTSGKEGHKIKADRATRKNNKDVIVIIQAIMLEKE